MLAENAATPTLLVALRRAIRTRPYSPRTEEVYVRWVRCFIRYCGMRHPRMLGAAEVSRFLSSLAVEGHVSASTQNQALAALMFLYRDVLEIPVGWQSRPQDDVAQASQDAVAAASGRGADAA